MTPVTTTPFVFIYYQYPHAELNETEYRKTHLQAKMKEKNVTHILKLQFEWQNISAGITDLKFGKEEIYMKLKELIKDTVAFKCSQQTLTFHLQGKIYQKEYW